MDDERPNTIIIGKQQISFHALDDWIIAYPAMCITPFEIMTAIGSLHHIRADRLFNKVLIVLQYILVCHHQNASFG